MKRKIITATLALMIAVSVTVPTYAAPSNTDLLNSEQKANDAKTKYNEAKLKVENIDTQIYKMDNSISEIVKRQNQLEVEIQKSQKDIEAAEVKIEKKKKEVAEKEDVYNERMIEVYKNGKPNVLEVLFSSNSLSDAITKLDGLKTVSKYEKGLLEELVKEKIELDKEKENLKSIEENLKKLNKEQEEKRSELEAQKEEQYKLLDEAKVEQANMEAILNSAEGELSEIKAELEKQKNLELEAQKEAEKVKIQQQENANNTSNNDKSNSSGNNSSGTSNQPSTGNATGDAIINYAYNFLGTPYVWGGKSPSGFDCSGFVYWVYKNFNINVGGSTYAQATKGKAVSKSELQKGDLVFFGSDLHHVGIYIGGGAFIHSPKTNDVVKITQLSYMPDFYMARRII